VDITAFIRELLFGHDCVIVPGFGGFIGNYAPARIDSSSGTFYPPVKKISFNRNLTHNDGLLVGRISGSSEMTYGDARNAVESFVSELRRKIEKGEKIIFDHIGKFYNNQEGSLQFEPDLNANYYPDSYGLESFQCLPVEGYDVRSRILKHAAKDPVRQSSVRRNLWRAAVIIPLLSALVFVPLKTDLLKSKIETSSLNPLVTAEFENNKKAVDENVTAEPVVAEPIVKEESSSPEVVVPVESGKYSIITGSFKSEENAEKQANILKSEGFSPEITVAPNGFFRVNALRCSDIATARIKKDSIAAKFPESWISMNR
jgi:hypothetical protein